MAKSIRSKRKRMLRNIKRERYAKKELEKLKQVVALAEKDKDADMKDLYTGKTTTINDIASFIEIHDCTLYLFTVDCLGQLITGCIHRNQYSPFISLSVCGINCN